MDDHQKQIKAVFDAALEITSRPERNAFLDEACANDAELRSRVEELLKAYDEAGSFLEVPREGVTVTVDQPVAQRAGTQIGPYKLGQLIGEGGFGDVYVAQQQTPVHRNVALKVVKPGMDTREVIARFEAERQALAMMDHPNIANVLGAGTTELGRPYFVMELVHGVPITEYCDTHNLTTRERLGLFIDVCHAVQHAHQKGIIHRDLKPSNILVTLQDGQPLPKVIDFGVSKALNQQLTEKTLFTAYGQMIGTPQYMSPEQAEMSGLDVDTRADVYSLGVLLYELLTGTTPIDGQRLREVGYAEMQRIIREEEPPKPSTRVSTLGEHATVIARHRRLEAGRLRNLLAGELDWIAMKSLEKERSRRYETANLLAQDIEHYLQDEAVAACPPSTGYRLRKFARRHRRLVAAAAAIGSLLVVVTALNTLLAARAYRAELLADERRENERSALEVATTARQSEAALREQAVRQRDEAVAAEQEAANQRELAVTAQQKAVANFRQAREAVDQYLDTIRNSALLDDWSMRPLRAQLLESARTFYQAIVEKQAGGGAPSPDVAAAHYRRGQILEELGDRDSARAAYQAARGSFEPLVASTPTAELQIDLADVCRRLGDFPAAIRHAEAVLAADANQAPARRVLHHTHMDGAGVQEAAGRAAEALQSYEQARQAILPLTSGQSPAAADLAALCSTHLAVGNLQRREQDLAAAITATRTALESAERACRVEPQTAGYRELVAVSQRRAARLLRANEQSEEAISFYRRAIATWSKLAFEQPALPGFKADLMRTWRELAAYQHALGRPDDAALTERRAAQYFRELPQSVGEDCFQVAVVCAQLAAAPAEDELAPTPEDEARRGADGQRAVEALGEAIKLGYQPPTDLASHPLLAHLSTREDFRRLAAAVRLPTTTGGTPTASGNAKAPSTPDLSLRLTILGSLRGIADAQRSLNQLEDSQATLEQCQQQLDELAQQHAQDNPAIVAERGHILYALGHVHWQAQRYLQAKQAWDEGYEVLQRAYAAASQTDRSQMGRAASRQEHELIHVYGRVGAWHEAGRHRARYIAFDRCADSESEALLTVLTRVADAGESYDDACRYMFDRFAREDPSYTAWALSFGEQPVLSPAQVVELAKQKLSDPGRSEWKRTVLGYCQLRTGHGADAVQNILELKDWNHHFVALAIHQIGDNEAARVWLDIGERAYTSSARNWLASASLDCRLLSQDLGQTWWEMLRVQVMRREAWQAIANESAVDPWAKLFEASGAAIVGDATGSETAFRAAVEMAAKDARVWVTRAETRAVLKQYEQAEQDFAKAIELEPANPEWWIARGKFYLERGLDAQADADYQRAAEFSPDDLDIFLRTGVWAVGPYPAAMNQSFPPEETPHPSRPVKKQDANGEVSNTSGRWTRIPLHYLDDNWGNVVLNSLTGNAANVSAYALAIVYSPRPRTASVMLSSGQHLRLWVNGACVYDDPTPTSNHEALERVPVSLQQGRNELLVRISTKDQNCSFMLRLGDAPIERAWVAAQLMQWDEAVAAFEKIPLQQLVRAGHHWFTYCRCLAAAENREHFETAVRLAYSWRRYRHHVAWQLVWLLRSGSMMPTGTLTRDEWLALVKDYGEPSYNWGKAAKLRSLYRAGEFAETVDYCNRQPDLVNPDDLFERLAVDPILAMAYHQLGQTAEANEQLQKANEQFRSRMAARVERPGVEAEIPLMMSPHGWALLTEANRLIRGVELKDDPTYQFLQQKIARELAAIRPELADHDLALLFQPNEPRLYLARAQRFADLSRWEEAEADFQKATSLKSDDPLNWLAIGQYWLSRQNLAQAGESYARAVELDHTQAWTHVLNKVLTGNDALLAAALATQPQNAELWTLRGQQMCEAGRWAKAAEAWQKRIALGQTDHMTQYQLALLQAASGKVNGYGETCRKMLEQFAAAETSEATNFVAWACVVAPGALADYAPAVQLAQQFADANFALPFAHNTLGAALLRSGRADEAVRELTLADQWIEASETMGQTSPAYAWYLLAIAHSQLGQSATARQWYDKASSWVAQTVAERERAGQLKWPWNRRLTIELLEREAAQVLQDAAHEGT